MSGAVKLQEERRKECNSETERWPSLLRFLVLTPAPFMRLKPCYVVKYQPNTREVLGSIPSTNEYINCHINPLRP